MFKLSNRSLLSLIGGCRLMQRAASYSSSSTYDPSTRIVREPLYKQVGIIGFPTNLGQPNSGVQMGPRAIRRSGLFESIEAMGIELVDYGDMRVTEVFPDPPKFGLRHPRTHAENAMNISQSLQVALNHQGKENILFCIGGDHSVSLGTVHGHAQVNKDMVLLWIDAHADCNTCLTSGSGNVHGMPLSFLINELQEFVPRMEEFDELRPCISFKDIAFIGLRDIDPGERYLLEKFGVTYYGMQEVDHLGIQEVVRRSLQEVNPGFKRPIHLSFDIDSLDPGFAKCTGTPVPAGLTLREGLYIAEEVHRTGCLKVVDLVEVNPDLGDPAQSEVTVNAAKEVIRACFGWQRAGIVPSNYQIPMPADVNAESRVSLLREK
ncbi:hypothetical protein BOX15_Mlig021759g1 [Macrostomum lignano]|uniref:Uncharacterized protein n=3 Tax=Macrostomum lignano TaxID=282301 RepID=A0A267GPH4_9PLAT|nr:hypothetical protein BOX15_Mlig021759g3 [Macrostomum lignano]PAA87192.1 hypothetical protein BOX15_Mlig021759g1 [Macrostomum lignano]